MIAAGGPSVAFAGETAQQRSPQRGEFPTSPAHHCETAHHCCAVSITELAMAAEC